VLLRPKEFHVSQHHEILVNSNFKSSILFSGSGDSGSALISRKTKKIVGILSYVKDAENGIDMGYNDCKTNVPVVATRVSSYLDWISRKTGLHFEEDDESENEI
jgi:secreted trypsin-like serine protease